jgi:DNA-binding PadR family transcriptional regulator
MRAFWMARRGGPFPPFGGPFGGGPFGDDPFGGDGGPRRRHKRGDIKFALLELLAEQPRHGYDLIKELESRYAGFYRPSPGSVYPTLQLLEDEGHLTSEQVEGKRIYTITESGTRILAERQAEGDGHRGFRGGEGGEGLDALRRSSMALVEVVMQSARHGTPDQVAAVAQVIDGARREVYRILAGTQE